MQGYSLVSTGRELERDRKRRKGGLQKGIVCTKRTNFFYPYKKMDISINGFVLSENGVYGQIGAVYVLPP